MNAQAVVTEGTPTAERQRPQLEQRSLAGKAAGHGPVIGLAPLTLTAAAIGSSSSMCFALSVKNVETTVLTPSLLNYEYLSGTSNLAQSRLIGAVPDQRRLSSRL
jgi:hypothetical protein